MVKDKRYGALKLYITSGGIKNFHDIFDIIPKSKISVDAGINYVRLNKKIASPDKFTVRDIILLAELFEVDEGLLYKLMEKAVDKKGLRKHK